MVRYSVCVREREEEREKKRERGGEGGREEAGEDRGADDSGPGFLNLGTVAIRGRYHCRGRPGHCRVFISIPGL